MQETRVRVGYVVAGCSIALLFFYVSPVACITMFLVGLVLMRPVFKRQEPEQKQFNEDDPDFTHHR